MNDGAKALYGSIIGAGSSSGGGGSNLKFFTLTYLDAGKYSHETRQFVFEQGMTWQDFVNSDYNPIVYTDDYYQLFSIQDGGEDDMVAYHGAGNNFFITSTGGVTTFWNNEILDTAYYEVDYA